MKFDKEQVGKVWRWVRWPVWVVGMIVVMVMGLIVMVVNMPHTDCACEETECARLALGFLFAAAPLALSWLVGWIGGRRLLVPSVALVAVVEIASFWLCFTELRNCNHLRSVADGGYGRCSTWWIYSEIAVFWLAIATDLWLVYRRAGRRQISD